MKIETVFLLCLPVMLQFSNKLIGHQLSRSHIYLDPTSAWISILPDMNVSCPEALKKWWEILIIIVIAPMPNHNKITKLQNYRITKLQNEVDKLFLPILSHPCEHDHYSIS